MISYFDASGNLKPLSAYEDYHIVHKGDGCDEMSFRLDVKLPQRQELYEECRILTDDNDWLVKKIDDDRIGCKLNFDFLKGTVYQNYKSESRSLYTVLESHLPRGWTITGMLNVRAGNIRRTIEFDICTDYDVIYECMSTYGVSFVWNIPQKQLTVIVPEAIQPSGEYITTELNLRSLSFKGDSVDFATRLYAYGKEGLSLADAIVDGKPYGKTYVENTSYVNKTICAYWVDERYTVAESLYEDATKKLAALSFPVRSYECAVVDLAKQNPKYHFLDLAIHKKLTLLDPERGIKVEHQIVEYDEYPEESDRNVITLSCVPDTVQSTINRANSSVVEEQKKISTDLNTRITMATAMLTSVFGSYSFVENGTIYMMDTPDRATAKIVWRWNVYGFGKSSTGINGPYTTALTFDDTFITNVINALVIRGDLIEANSIQASAISQSYSDGVLTQAYNAANGLVEATFQQISSLLSNSEGTGQIDVLQKTINELRQSIDGITASFTREYQGGINYIRNSSGVAGITDDWGTVGTVVSMQNADTKNSTVSNSCFRLSGGAQLYQSVDNIISGNTYVVGLKVKKTSDLSAYIKIIYDNDKEAILLDAHSESFDWVNVTVVIEHIQSPNIRFEAYSTGNDLYISDIMLCEGNVQKAWTPAPNEIYTSGVQIDHRGIEVYRAGTTEKTSITNREFSGYYKGEQIFSINRDETHIRKTFVDGDLTVGRVKIMPYEYGEEAGLNLTVLD